MNTVHELRGQDLPTALGSRGEEGNPFLSGQGGCPGGGQVHPRKASVCPHQHSWGTPQPQPMHYVNALKWMFSLSDLKQ